MMSTGYLGVDLFFILSGFILALNYAERLADGGIRWDNYKDFLLARLARIYPVHLFSLLILVPAVYAMQRLGMEVDAVRFSGRAFAENVFLVHG